MVIARGIKTYTVNLEIDSDEEIRNSFLFYEEGENRKKVTEYIEKNVRPLVPFKKVKNFGWKKIMEETDTVYCTLYIEVTFNLEDEKCLRVFI